MSYVVQNVETLDLQVYKSMDDTALKNRRVYVQSIVDYSNRAVKEAEMQVAALKKEIKVQQKVVIQAQQELLKIEEACKAERQIAYVTVIYITKQTDSVYLGKGEPHYYARSEWKDQVVYKYSVYKENVLGADKGNALIRESGTFANEAKGLLLRAVIHEMKTQKIKKIVLKNGARVNTAELRKADPTIEIISEKR